MIVESQWRVNGIWVPCTDASVPAFTDESGKPVNGEILAKGDLALVCHKNTDVSGWTYGASFNNLGLGRSGGRRQARILDRVRQRMWVPPSSSTAASFELPGFETHSSCSPCGKGQDALSMVDIRSDAPATERSVSGRSVSPTLGSLRQVKFVAQGVDQFNQEWMPGTSRSRSKTRGDDSEDVPTPALSARCLARHKEAMDRKQAEWEPLLPPIIVPEVILPLPALPVLLQGNENILWEVEHGQSLTRQRFQRLERSNSALTE